MKKSASDSVNLGSNPGPPANKINTLARGLRTRRDRFVNRFVEMFPILPPSPSTRGGALLLVSIPK